MRQSSVFCGGRTSAETAVVETVLVTVTVVKVMIVTEVCISDGSDSGSNDNVIAAVVETVLSQH